MEKGDDLEKNFEHLIAYVNQFFDAIMNSINECPAYVLLLMKSNDIVNLEKFFSVFKRSAEKNGEMITSLDTQQSVDLYSLDSGVLLF